MICLTILRKALSFSFFKLLFVILQQSWGLGVDCSKKPGFLKIDVVLQHIIEHQVKTSDWVWFILNFQSLF